MMELERVEGEGTCFSVRPARLRGPDIRAGNRGGEIAQLDLSAPGARG